MDAASFMPTGRERRVGTENCMLVFYLIAADCRLCLSEPVAVNLVCLKAIIFNQPQQLLWAVKELQLP